ncbi:amidase [Lichenifustis flavocetrariae]|uniref:Indoleacetamide hydrolase n=1 Tax=Lichenifustis flavocetrariae TaxID=2949735 RepID=A0AA41Z1R7_9HYPH|nr:amidase [Lichenifustis flavocetrariae]MCW6511250.1 amidase [Lichenifustis flavocetrariae]
MIRTIADCAAALRRGDINAEALLEECLGRIRRLEPHLNSFVFLDEAGARQAARGSDVRLAAGASRSPLEGVPLSIKDSILVADMPATWGSRAFADLVPDRDELPVARLRAAGAVIVGKTNVPELTLEGYTKNDLFGVTRNPWNHALTPGGSSGGAAAGVAAGLVAAALGTDGGGSIRRPACHTGLVGFKPSVGRYPRIDGFPALLTDFETVGTLSHSIEDALILDAVLAGPDARDRRSLCAPAQARSPGPARILYLPRFGPSPIDPDVAEATERMANGLAESGHTILREPLFFSLEDVARIWQVVTRSGVAWLADRDEARIGRQLGAAARTMAEDGRTFSGADYFDALDRVTSLRRLCAERFADIDFVLTPTAAALPWPAEQPFPTEIAGQPAGPRDHAVFTGWVNLAGLPGVSLPVGVSQSGLPIGVQLVAGFGADAALLAFAGEVMARYPRLSPPMSVDP